jgi:thiaminase
MKRTTQLRQHEQRKQLPSAFVRADRTEISFWSICSMDPAKGLEWRMRD